MNNWNKLAVFLEVAKNQNISESAENLYLTPSAISQSIKGLEDELGVSLFYKKGRQIALTAEGLTLYNDTREHFFDLKKSIENFLKPRESEFHGVIRLGVFSGFPSVKFGPIFEEIVQSHQLKIKLVFGSSSELIDKIEKNDLDIAITISSTKRGRVSSDILYRDELILVSSKRPPKRSLRMDELLKAPFIDYYENNSLIKKWIKFHLNKKVGQPNVLIYAGTADLVVDLILKGIGIGVVPRSVAWPFVKEGKLFIVRSGRKQVTMDTYITHSHQMNMELYYYIAELLKRHFSFQL